MRLRTVITLLMLAAIAALAAVPTPSTRVDEPGLDESAQAEEVSQFEARPSLGTTVAVVTSFDKIDIPDHRGAVPSDERGQIEAKYATIPSEFVVSVVDGPNYPGEVWIDVRMDCSPTNFGDVYWAEKEERKEHLHPELRDVIDSLLQRSDVDVLSVSRRVIGIRPVEGFAFTEQSVRSMTDLVEGKAVCRYIDEPMRA